MAAYFLLSKGSSYQFLISITEMEEKQMKFIRSRRQWLATIATMMAVAVLVPAAFAGDQHGYGDHDRDGDHWFAAWAGPQRDTGEPTDSIYVFVADTTIREAVWVTLGGDQVRVKFSNAFGPQPLDIGAASVALKSTDAAVTPGTVRALTFGGQPSVTVPIQGFVLSDPVKLHVPALTDVSISIFLPNGSGESARYPGSRKTTYIAEDAGDQTQALDLPFTSTSTSNGYFVSAVEVHNRQGNGVIACLGDSIVAGGGTDAENLKWSDRLAARINSKRHPLSMGVLGLGIGGNRVLSGATSNPAALERFDRDVMGMAGLTHIILADGVNDLGSTASMPSDPPNAEDVEYGVTQLVERAHARGVKVIGTTMGPAWGFRDYENVDFKRLAYNAWMRTVAVKMLDGLIDFDKLLNDPSNPSHMLPEYLTDGIHPNDAGHQAMADYIDLRLFRTDDSDKHDHHDDRGY